MIPLGSEYFRYSSIKQSFFDHGYPKPMSMFSEKISFVNAAFGNLNGKTVFFQSTSYFVYDDNSSDVRKKSDEQFYQF